MNWGKIPNLLEWSHLNLNMRSIKKYREFFISNLKKLEYRRFSIASFAIYRHEIYRHIPNKHHPPPRIGDSGASKQSLVPIPLVSCLFQSLGLLIRHRISNPIYFTDNRDCKIRYQRYYRISPDIYCRCGEPCRYHGKGWYYRYRYYRCIIYL